ncbi:MAG: hypothetical protein AAGI69_22900 [Cyanobacteria bacterium P01_H01_bin.21]
MKIAIDNIALIKTFFKGKESLLANRELRVEKALDEIQLLTTQGILLAKGRLAVNSPKVLIRLRSDYWALIHQLALEAGFVPLSIEQDRLAGVTFAQYDYYSVPAGYQIHCQEASMFWKTWWINHRRMQLMDILLLFQNRWYPVNHMVCDTGTIYIKTWRGEQTLSLSDTVVWLDRNTQTERQVRVRKRPVQDKPILTKYPYHDDLVAAQSTAPVEQPPTAPVEQPTVSTNLQQVVQVDGPNRLIIHTVLGPIAVEGQHLTCDRVRKVAQVS